LPFEPAGAALRSELAGKFESIDTDLKKSFKKAFQAAHSSPQFVDFGRYLERHCFALLAIHVNQRKIKGYL
jgi:hypothetical protein